MSVSSGSRGSIMSSHDSQSVRSCRMPISHRCLRAALVVLATLIVTPADVFAQAAAPHPCTTDPNYRTFDFWIGEWDVQPTGVPRAASGATSRIEKQLDGCVLQENWEPRAGAFGKSFNIYNRVTRKWEQF